MKAKMMTMKMLTAAIAVVGLSSGVMADSAGHNLDATASKETSKPKPVREQIFIYQVEHANAEDIKTCIDTLVNESRKEVPTGCATNAAEVDSVLFRGKVVVIADKYSNKLIIIMSHCDRIDEISEDAEVVRRKLAELEKVRVEKGLKSWAQIDSKIRDEIDKKYPCSFMLDKTRQ